MINPMIKHNKKIIFALLLVLFTMVLIQGCGNEQTAPAGSKIILTPLTTSATIVAAGVDVCFPMLVTVDFSDGSPMNKANVTIYGSFAAPNAIVNYQFYLDPNCNAPGAANRSVDSGFTVSTDVSGNYNFSVLVIAANGAFTDNITAVSGAASAAAKLTIN